ncbi:hypothetical protein AURDEDRAFT_170581 [Auricularia subglabra TFB-10046 SS5]|nr:hypothetical protein AURDEDRAFT_170581 [Auricularia subglabra TFB-10046 SS5]
MVEAVDRYFARFHSINWSCNPSTVDISRPAPLLREFYCSEWMCILPRDFLGGAVGALRTLHLHDSVFPESCPALETVTDLEASYPEFSEEDRRFYRIFDLCPRLEVLRLRDLEGDPGDELPTGPAPRTLRKVVLESIWQSCNVVQLYTLWGLESVPDVRLRMQFGVSFRIAPFIDGAIEILVRFDDSQDMHLRARLSGARKRVLKCERPANVYTEEIANFLVEMLRHGAALSHMKSLRVPLSVLGSALSGAYHWPRITHLTVNVCAADVLVHSYHMANGYPQLRWTPLECLCSAPSLESLALHVYADGMLTFVDARNLRGYLSTLSGCIPSDVQVHGFPEAVAREMMAHDGDGPRIAFSERDLEDLWI